jgi:hypothetical protein
MSESEAQARSPQPERKFSQEQYDLLMRSAEARDLTEWNQHTYNEILLEGADLDGAYLVGARLNNAHLEGAYLGNADLQGASLVGARLEGAHLWGANLTDAYLNMAHLNGAHLSGANLTNARLGDTHLEGASFNNAHLAGAGFQTAFVDSSTLFWHCRVDRRTDFGGVGLDSLRIEPGTKQLLEYNIRRMNWEKWYITHPWLQRPVRVFWWLSDYGQSTGRVVLAFLILSLGFAAIYYASGAILPPGIVSNLFEGPEGPVPNWLVPVRTVYFSVVTMTTLGFGDMHANCQSLLGHILLTVQVLLGYVLLGALVTRLAILFSSGGPSGTFVDWKGE